MKFIEYLVSITIIMVLVSCQTDQKLTELIDQNSPIILFSRPRNIELNKPLIDTISVNSDKWNQFMSFASRNSSGWEPTPASFNPDYLLRQVNFQLMGWEGGKYIVLNYIDSNGQANQLTKTIDPGELNFLFE